MLLNVVLWSFLIMLAPIGLDLALELTVEIVRQLVAMLREPFERPFNGDRLASQSWSQPTSR